MLVGVVLAASVAEGLVLGGTVWIRANLLGPAGDRETFVPFATYPHTPGSLPPVNLGDHAIRDALFSQDGQSQAEAVRNLGIIPGACDTCSRTFHALATEDAFLTLYVQEDGAGDAPTYQAFSEYVARMVTYCLVNSQNTAQDGSIDTPVLPVFQELMKLRSKIDYSVLQRRYLKRSQSLIAGVLQALSHPFYVFDAEKFEIIVSNTPEDARTYSSGFYEKSSMNRMRGVEISTMVEFLRAVKSSGKPLSLEQTLSNGQVLDVHGYPVFDERQIVKQIIVYSWDISDRKRLEEEQERIFKLHLAMSRGVTHLMQSSTLQDGIRGALDELGKGLAVDRILYCEYNHDTDQTRTAHEWNRKETSKHANQTGRIIQTLPPWLQPLKNGESVVKDQITDRERKAPCLLDAQTEAALAFPHLQHGTLSGFLLVLSDEPGRVWNQTEIELAKIAVANLFNFRSKMETLERLRSEVEQRKRLETELRQSNENLEATVASRTARIQASEKRYADLFNFAMDAIFVMSDTGEILSSNMAAETLTGYGKSELLGLNVRQLFTHEMFQKMLPYVNKLMQTGSISLETNFQRKSGDILPVEITARFMEIDEDRLIQAFARDISERKQSELLKDEFVSNVSHELRTPITSFLSSAQILKYYWDRLDEAEKRKKIDEIIQGGKNFESLVENLLALSRIDKKTLRVRPEISDLNELLKDGPDLVPGGRERIELALGKGVPSLSFDQELIRVVLGNLLENAMKFSTGDAKIHLTSGYDETSRVAWFAVTDQGIGIEEKNLELIFNRFFRIETASHSISGTGLGLSIAKKYVELHDGWIQVESTPGKGAQFTVHLPVHTEAE